MTYVIAKPCVDILDKACIDECPVDCIYEGSRMMYIQPDECVDCGACEPVCPVEAIFYEDDLPTEVQDYRQYNADFFLKLGSPGAAQKVGPTEHDPPVIAAIPRSAEGAKNEYRSWFGGQGFQDRPGCALVPRVR
jgi:ferredoxin